MEAATGVKHEERSDRQARLYAEIETSRATSEKVLIVNVRDVHAVYVR